MMLILKLLKLLYATTHIILSWRQKLIMLLLLSRCNFFNLVLLFLILVFVILIGRAIYFTSVIRVILLDVFGIKLKFIIRLGGKEWPWLISNAYILIIAQMVIILFLFLISILKQGFLIFRAFWPADNALSFDFFLWRD